MVAPIASATPNLRKGHVPNKGAKGKNCNKELANFFQQPFDFPIGGHFTLITYNLCLEGKNLAAEIVNS